MVLKVRFGTSIGGEESGRRGRVEPSDWPFPPGRREVVDYGDLSGVEVPAGGIIIVLALGKEKQLALGVAFGHAK